MLKLLQSVKPERVATLTQLMNPTTVQKMQVMTAAMVQKLEMTAATVKKMKQQAATVQRTVKVLI